MKETSKKIGVSQPWFFNTYDYSPSLLNIQQIIVGSLNKYGILTSDIYISEYSKLYVFHFTIFLSNTKQYNILDYTLKYLKSLLIIRYNKNIIFNVKLSPSIYHDDKILSNWLKTKLQDDPNKLRLLMKGLVNQKMESKPSYFSVSKDNQDRIVHLRMRRLKNKKSFNYYNKKTFLPL